MAEATTAPGETIHATCFEVTAGMVEAAIWTADALAKDYMWKAALPSPRSVSKNSGG